MNSMLTLDIIENWDAFAMGLKELEAKRAELQLLLDELDAHAPEDRNNTLRNAAMDIMGDIEFNIADWKRDMPHEPSPPVDDLDVAPWDDRRWELRERKAMFIHEFFSGALPPEGTPEREYFDSYFAN